MAQVQPPVLWPWPNTAVGALIQEPAPLEATIQEWTKQRARNTSEANIHYEHSMYGNFNGILSAVFPTRRQFMVKPQGLLRPRFDLDPANTSLDSNGAPAESRGVTGPEEDKQYPDFIVVKATERMDADRIILVFELKRDELGNATGVAQLRKYMQRIGLKPANLLVDVVGYLVSPRRTQEHRLLAPGPNGRRAWADRQIFPSGSDSFVAAIHAFAIAEWNT